MQSWRTFPTRPRWGEQLASDSVQERTREAAAHERIVHHMILLRLLLALATGQRGSAMRLRETNKALEALCWL